MVLISWTILTNDNVYQQMHIIGSQRIHKIYISATCFDVELPFTGGHKYERSQAPERHRINKMSMLYYSVQNLLSSGLLSKNLKITIYRTIILSTVLYGCETWLLHIEGGT
jgi:uncharacterized membrane protein